MGHGTTDFPNMSGDLNCFLAAVPYIPLYSLVDTPLNSTTQMQFAFGTNGEQYPVAVDAAAPQFELKIFGVWRSPIATSIYVNLVVATYAFDVRGATDYRILTNPTGLIFGGPWTLQVPVSGVPAIVGLDIEPVGSVDPSSVVVDGDGVTTWAFTSHVSRVDNPQTELQLKIGGNWVSPTATTIVSNNAVCTYAADATTATDWRIAGAPTNLAFSNHGAVSYPQSGVPSLPPSGVGVASVAFMSHGKGKMVFDWTFASPVSAVDAGDGVSCDATGLQIDGADPVPASGVIGSGIFDIVTPTVIRCTYVDTSVTTGATYLVQSQPPGITETLQVGATGLTT